MPSQGSETICAKIQTSAWIHDSDNLEKFKHDDAHYLSIIIFACS